MIIILLLWIYLISMLLCRVVCREYKGAIQEYLLETKELMTLGLLIKEEAKNHGDTLDINTAMRIGFTVVVMVLPVINMVVPIVEYITCKEK